MPPVNSVPVFFQFLAKSFPLHLMKKLPNKFKIKPLDSRNRA